MQSVAYVVGLIIEYISDLPRMECIDDLEGNLFDMRFEIQANVCMYQ